MDDIIVIEDFFPIIIWKQLLQKVDHSEPRWAFSVNNPSHWDDDLIARSQKNNPKIREDIGYFQYRFYDENGKKNDIEMADLFKNFISKKIQIDVTNIIRINCNMVVPCDSFKDYEYMLPHIDTDKPHRSLVYYLHDCDGDTILFDKFYDGIKENIDGVEVVKRYKPKKNTCITFNGFRYHSASPSKTKLRKVINVNYC